MTDMRNKHPRMKLYPEEETFLRHWMYEETHFREGPGPAKHLQLHHKVKPADLATLIAAAAFPDLDEQECAGTGPPPSESSTWPWSTSTFPVRLEEALKTLASLHAHRRCTAGQPQGQRAQLAPPWAVRSNVHRHAESVRLQGGGPSLAHS